MQDFTTPLTRGWFPLCRPIVQRPGRDKAADTAPLSPVAEDLRSCLNRTSSLYFFPASPCFLAARLLPQVASHPSQKVTTATTATIDKATQVTTE